MGGVSADKNNGEIGTSNGGQDEMVVCVPVGDAACGASGGHIGHSAAAYVGGSGVYVESGGSEGVVGSLARLLDDGQVYGELDEPVVENDLLVGRRGGSGVEVRRDVRVHGLGVECERGIGSGERRGWGVVGCRVGIL